MSDRPNPLGKVASTVGVAWSALAGLVGALVMFGVLTTAQANAIQTIGSVAPDTITAIGTAIGGIMAMLSGVVAAFRTVAHGKDDVTPVVDPRDYAGNRLIPAGPFADGGAGA